MSLQDRLDRDLRTALLLGFLLLAVAQVGLMFLEVRRSKLEISNATLDFTQNLAGSYLRESSTLFLQREMQRFHATVSQALGTAIAVEVWRDGQLLADVGSLENRSLTSRIESSRAILDGTSLKVSVAIAVVDILRRRLAGLFVTFLAMLFVYVGVRRRTQNRLREALLPLHRLALWAETSLEHITAVEMSSSRDGTSVPHVVGTTEVERLAGAFDSLVRERASSDSAGTERLDEQREDLARIAHDIRSPLSALSLIADPTTQMNAEYQELLRLTVKRIQEISESILSISRKQESVNSEANATSIIPLLERLLKEKRQRWRDRAEIQFEVDCRLDPGISHVTLSESDLGRALSNLIDNAVEATEGPGIISLILENERGQVRLSVVDTGKGMSQETLSKIGVPGGTYYKAGGTGLGLYSAKKLLSSAGGSLNISSIEGQGTTAILLIPRA